MPSLIRHEYTPISSWTNGGRTPAVLSVLIGFDPAVTPAVGLLPHCADKFHRGYASATRSCQTWSLRWTSVPPSIWTVQIEQPWATSGTVFPNGRCFILFIIFHHFSSNIPMQFCSWLGFLVGDCHAQTVTWELGMVRERERERQEEMGMEGIRDRATE